MVEGSDHCPTQLDESKLKELYITSKNRLFFLDYDGTLTPIVPKPEDAAPTPELKQLLKRLSSDPKNRIYIISGRDRQTLGEWMGDVGVGMSAEHGCFVRPLSKHKDKFEVSAEWKDLIQGQGIEVGWKEPIIELFKKSSQTLKGVEIEIKEYAVTFHYRQCAKEDYKLILNDLRHETNRMAQRYPTLNIVKGKKTLEARIKGITKGFIIEKILDLNTRDSVDFVFCAGDDVTDEDMFKELTTDQRLPVDVFTCIVGKKNSAASSYVENQKEVLEVLQNLANSSEHSQTK